MIKVTSIMIREVDMTKDEYMRLMVKEVDSMGVLVNYRDLIEKGRSFALWEGRGDRISQTIEIKEL